MMKFKVNNLKYISLLILFLIGLEVFKLGLFIFIFKFIGNFWFVIFLYLLI